jgi:hypothetical protein
MSGYVCPECGLDYDAVSPDDIVVAVRSFPRRYREALEGASDDGVRARPAPEVWSALEYTAHLADLFPAFTDSVRRMRTGQEIDADRWWDADARATEQKYADRDPDDVLRELTANAGRLADALSGVDADEWTTTTAEFPWGERDLLVTARNAVHEGSHHLRDVQHALRDAGPD